MKTFEFKGEVSSSKSYYNRALILSHYKNDLEVIGHSDSRDVTFLKQSLQEIFKLASAHGSSDFSNHPTIELEVGEGGTTLRFLSFLVSRMPGNWRLKGSSRLFSRPQSELQNLIRQLGCEVLLGENFLEIKSRGWQPLDELKIDLSKSSQFASGVILNSWGLPFELNLSLSAERVSDGYLEMTLDLVKSTGMEFSRSSDHIRIPSSQSIKTNSIQVEQDVSSAFVVASLAAGRGHCEIKNFPFQSLQPDVRFIKLFKDMNVPLKQVGASLFVDRVVEMKPVQISLRDAPDLFPVLCVLLTKARGESRIVDTPQLVHKESNRLQKTSELLKFMKVEHELLPDGIVIKSLGRHHHEFFEFDPDEDHRLAFAGALARSFGYRMRIKHPEVVNKSFPGFWELIGGGPG